MVMNVDELIAPLPSDARFSAYYFDFEPTGVGIVDAILSAVTVAGKGSHHTDGWMQEGEYYTYPRPGIVAGESAADMIQKNAERSAEVIRSLIAERDAALAVIDVARSIATQTTWTSQTIRRLRVSLNAATK